MIPNQAFIFDAVETAVKSGGRSCFSCMCFQLRDHGERIICTARPNTEEASIKIGPSRVALITRRAERCKQWEGDDD